MAWNRNRQLQYDENGQPYDPTQEDLDQEQVDPEDQPPSQNAAGGLGRAAMAPPQLPPQVQQAPPPNPGPPPMPPQQGAMPPNPGPPPGVTNLQVPGQPPMDQPTRTDIQVPGQGPVGPPPNAGMPPPYKLPPMPQPGAYTFSGDKPVEHPSVMRRIGGALLGYASGEGIGGMVRGAMRPGYEQAVGRAGQQAGQIQAQAKLDQEAVKTQQEQAQTRLYGAQAEHARAQADTERVSAKAIEAGGKEQYMKVGDGVFDKHAGRWVEMPTNKNELVPIGADYARKNLPMLQPDGDGNYFVPIKGFEAIINNATKQPTGGELPLGAKVGQYQQVIDEGWRALHGAVPRPAAYTLRPDATEKDFDKISQSLRGAESVEGTKATRDAAAAARATAEAAREQVQADKQDKEGRSWVQGVTANGEMVAAPVSQAKSLGLMDVADLPQAEVGKVMAARHWLPLAEKQGATPDKMGILQLVDALDKRGALGPIASRWNEFMVGKFGGGSGNPDTDRLVSALRNKIRLSQTLLMNLHVGNRGGAYLMEHFEDMANAGKMNGNILRTGVQSELDYARDRAMQPPQGNPAPRTPLAAPTGGQRGAAGGEPKSFDVTDPRGTVHHFPTQAAADKFKAAARIP